MVLKKPKQASPPHPVSNYLVEEEYFATEEDLLWIFYRTWHTSFKFNTVRVLYFKD